MSYKDHHRVLVNALREVGIWFDYAERLDLAWLRHYVGRVSGDTPRIDAIRGHIDICVRARTKGLEPKHENGRYT
jgi:hypothetical protein